MYIRLSMISNDSSDDYMRQLSDWLSPLAGEFEDKQQDTFNLEARQDGVGQWLQRNCRFQTWYKDTGTLWCTGIRIPTSSYLQRLITGANDSVACSIC